MVIIRLCGGMMRFISILSVLFIGLNNCGADYTRYADFIRRQAENETFVKLFEEHLKLFQSDKDDGNLQAMPPFTCKPFLQPDKKSKNSVHELTPLDIKVVGALGDSITAGTGITAGTVIGLLREDRGLSWSIGGDGNAEEDKTIPNFLRVYNPNLRGYSTGWGPVWLESVSHLNLAHPGDKSQDIPGQAEELVKRMKADDKINFDEDWKLITLFVGGNDLCKYCEDTTKYSAESYVKDLETALDYLHGNVPRVFVNLVQILDVAILKKLNANFVCDTLHLFLCDCAAFPKNSEAEAKLMAETERYRDLTRKLVQTGRYDTREDFTVVLQPFFSNTIPPKKSGTDEPDLSYFAPDCFHLSLKGHQAAAEGLWNNMVEPVGKKRNTWSPGEAVQCPSAAAPYFYTYKNSHGNSSNLLGQNPGGPDIIHQAPMFKSPENTEEKGGQSVAAMATVFAVAGSVVVVLSVVGVIVWRRRHHTNKERYILLQSPNVQQYT